MISFFIEAQPNIAAGVALPQLYHIETHFRGFELGPYSLCTANVFLYGRGVRERSEFYRLKAGYFTLKFHPHMVHALRIELSLSG